jgi:hypothetical protein
MLEILKANYNYLDVTKIIENKIINNEINMQVSNNYFGDPSPGIIKNLYIKYKYNNKIFEDNIKENEFLIINENTLAKLHKTKLSICICSTHNRYNNFLINMLNNLFSQYNSLNNKIQQEIEIISIIDNKKMTIGKKRNELLNCSSGEYVVFVDDDDRVSNDYIIKIYNATFNNSDVITFNVMVSLNNSTPKICYYSINYNNDYNTDNEYYRLPNHLMCVKKDIALDIKYLPINLGEDSEYAKQLKNKIKTEFNINEVLYYYDWNSNTTEVI